VARGSRLGWFIVKKRWIRWVIVALLIGPGLALAIPISRVTIFGILSGEPRFRGKPARYWFHAVREETGTGNDAAGKALVAGGPASLPVVLKMRAWDGGAFEPGWGILQEIDGETDRNVFTSALVEALRDKDKDVRLHAAYYLARTTVSSKRAAAIPVLVGALKDQAERNRFYAVEGLRILGESFATGHRFPAPSEEALGDDIKSAVPALIEALGDDDQTVRQRSAEALRNIDPEAAAKAGVSPKK
jgi:hypothetical protein